MPASGNMDTLKDRLNKDLTRALKAKNEVRVATLRFLNSVIHNKEIDIRAKTDGKDGVLTEEETLGILKSEAKKRKEAIDLYEKGGRTDLSEKESRELEIIESYLPAEMEQEELEKLVGEVFLEVKPSGPADFGKIMGAVMKKVEGRASGDRVKGLIEKKLKEQGE